jgi:hypothetical protein
VYCAGFLGFSRGEDESEKWECAPPGRGRLAAHGCEPYASIVAVRPNRPAYRAILYRAKLESYFKQGPKNP